MSGGCSPPVFGLTWHVIEKKHSHDASVTTSNFPVVDFLASFGYLSVERDQPQHRTIRFGVFEADLCAGELRKQGVKIRLQDQPFQILAMLLERPSEIVTREELQKRIWPPGTFVDFEQGVHNAIKRLREALSDSAETPRFIETVPRHGYRFIGNLHAGGGLIESLAVLPLENLSGDSEQEYFADGLTEALITSLAKISALRVVSRTSAMQFKGIRKPLREIARELGADGIVEGTVLRSGERVRISAQLIDARTDTHLWAESYERDLRDVLSLQDEVARAIASEIQIKLTPQERTHLRSERPVNPGAYEAYLKGRFYWNKRTGEGMKKGAEWLQVAVQSDPTYAPAYAGLADCSGLGGFWGFASPTEGCGKAKIAARQALEIDDSAEAHASLGWAILHYDFDHIAAEREFRRAIEINPRYATAHQWYGHCLAYVGRRDESIAETSRALELDPLSLIIHISRAGAFWLARNWDNAIADSQRALELDANFTPAHWLLAHGYDGKGLYEEAIVARCRAVEISGRAPVFLAELAGTYATAGKKDEALGVLEELRELSQHRYVMAYWIASIHARLHQKDDAFVWLEKACQERSPWLAWVRVDPRMDYLRADQSFQRLVSGARCPS